MTSREGGSGFAAPDGAACPVCGIAYAQHPCNWCLPEAEHHRVSLAEMRLSHAKIKSASCDHSWRLIEELNWWREPTPEEAAVMKARSALLEEQARARGAIVMQGDPIVSLGVRRRWYCANCRTLDETFEERADLAQSASPLPGVVDGEGA